MRFWWCPAAAATCHVPDMNPRIARSCTGRTDVYTAVRRSLIALSQSSAPFQSGGRNGPFKCLTINYSEHLCTRTQGTHYLDDPPVSRIEHASPAMLWLKLVHSPEVLICSIVTELKPNNAEWYPIVLSYSYPLSSVTTPDRRYLE